MLTDPQDIVVNGTTVSLPRTSVGKDNAEYRSADRAYKYAISHQYGKRNRHMVRLDYSATGVDPITGLNIPVSMSAYMVVDVPQVGIDAAAAKLRVDALLAELTAGSGALVTKVLGGES